MEHRGVKRHYADDDNDDDYDDDDVVDDGDDDYDDDDDDEDDDDDDFSDVEESRTTRKRHLDEIYNHITVDGRDRKASKKLVHDLLNDMLMKIKKQEGSHIYKQLYVDAGSHPVRAKIGKANEFDVNIPMTIQPAHVTKFGLVPYQHEDFKRPELGASTSTMTKDHKLVRTSEINRHTIPVGYCVVSIDNESTLPKKFIHRDDIGIINRSRSSGIDLIPSGIDLIPYDVKLDLYEKLSRAKNTDKVSLSRSPSGPALTLTIKQKGKGKIKHIINLDVTASIVYRIPLLGWIRWPRLQTAMAFGELVIKAQEAGTHLVPKKDLFWAISFSRMERVLLTGMDGDGGCRKFVYKMLKKYVEDCKSETDLPGISSHILKTQVLWSCEIHATDRNYWQQDNSDKCLMNTMQELKQSLISGTLKDYFNERLNVLNGKDRSVLLHLAAFIEARRSELLCMPE